MSKEEDEDLFKRKYYVKYIKHTEDKCSDDCIFCDWEEEDFMREKLKGGNE